MKRIPKSHPMIDQSARSDTAPQQPTMTVRGNADQAIADHSRFSDEVADRTTAGQPTATTLLVIAKAPIAGFAKTRLTPPLTPQQAAQVAAAALLDTLDAVLRADVAHRVVAFTGDLTAAERCTEITWALSQFEVVPQRGADFGTRLANAHADAARHGLPVLQIGMDTPQISAQTLTHVARELATSPDVLLGPAEDGGWWGLGLPAPQVARTLAEVPMSTDRTGEFTRKAMHNCGYRIRSLPTFSDVDHFDDAIRVAAESSGRFAKLIRELTRELVLR